MKKLRLLNWAKEGREKGGERKNRGKEKRGEERWRGEGRRGEETGREERRREERRNFWKMSPGYFQKLEKILDGRLIH